MAKVNACTMTPKTICNKLTARCCVFLFCKFMVWGKPTTRCVLFNVPQCLETYSFFYLWTIRKKLTWRTDGRTGGRAGGRGGILFDWAPSNPKGHAVTVCRISHGCKVAEISHDNDAQVLIAQKTRCECMRTHVQLLFVVQSKLKLYTISHRPIKRTRFLRPLIYFTGAHLFICMLLSMMKRLTYCWPWVCRNANTRVRYFVV